MFRYAINKIRPSWLDRPSFRLIQHHKKCLSTEQSQVTKEETPDPPKVPKVPSSSDVVIIGIAGCNLLYQLALRGVNAVLLEKSRITSGTTWHTAGLIWRLRPNDVEIQLLGVTRDLLMRLESETGFDPGWINNGGMYVAYTKERLDEYRRLATIGQTFGVESHILSPEETKKVFPLIDENVIHGTLYCPGDGVVDPAMLCNALTRSAVKAGGKFIESCPVTDILTDLNLFGSRQVSGVVTPYGTIKTNCVVNCCGVWSRELAAKLGIDLPLVPMKHAYVVTESIPGVRGLPNVRDHDASTYFRIQGDSLCMGGYEPNPIILDNVASDFEFSLYELDWIVFSAHMQGAVKLVPTFETAGIKSTVCGPESFTPDHKPLLGEDPRLFGLYHSCGYNSAGMMLGGGCGEQMAQWIINGRPDLHLFAYDIRRFTKEQTRNKTWIKERSHESYAKNYSIVFPHDQPLAGRNLYKDPFHKELLEAGCVFEERQGWERPGWFLKKKTAPILEYDWFGAYGSTRNVDDRYFNQLQGDYTFGFPKNHHLIGEECLACREQVALFDLSYFGKFYLCGPEAQQAADWLFTANTNRPFNKTVYSCLLNARGGVEGDVTITAIETGTGSQADPIFKKNFQVALTDHTDKLGVLSIQGPNSRDLLQPLTEEDLSNESFPYATSKLTRVAGYLCRMIRVSFVGELGWELHLPMDSCVPVYNALWENGKRFGLRHAGYRALNSLSHEKGYHLWNFDLRTDDLPIESGLGFTCREEGDFLGKNALEVEKRKGIRKRLTFFQLQEQIPVWGLETVWKDGNVVGYLRRGDYGYALGASIGSGYVRHPEGRRITSDFITNGHYQVEVMGKRYDAIPFVKSPFDPQSKRPRGIYDEPLPVRQ
ncbi:uncharacterized protein GBIM_12121 [Gryllus bimaculatus]|nr:uncharacterized protein GBIM_12121 [Gryllus bimaculatus]